MSKKFDVNISFGWHFTGLVFTNSENEIGNEYWMKKKTNVLKWCENLINKKHKIYFNENDDNRRKLKRNMSNDDNSTVL